MKNRTLFFGDNLEVLRDKFPDNCIDLIYLDPPFNSKRDYNILFKEGVVNNEAQIKAFEDSWHWTHETERTFEELIGAKPSQTKINAEISGLIQGFEKIIGKNDVMAYLVMMTIRLIELHRVLKPTGSLYLHCDPTSSHYLKTILDVIFDKRNFRNEIIWRYRRWPAKQKAFQRMHDIIFFYTKEHKNEHSFNQLYEPLSESTLKADKGLKIVNIFDEKGKRIRGKKTGEKSLGVPMSDVWEISLMAPTSKERLGYPTQKPEALLERIITTASKKGDLVLDPFCGCGTTIAVAEKLGRRWIGIDVTTLAINLIKHRLERQFHFSKRKIDIDIDGIPKDLSGAKELAEKDRFEFQYWALSLINAMPSRSKEKMKGPDKGIDGVIIIRSEEKEFDKIIVEVKSGKVQRSHIATLKGDVSREKALGGLFITLQEPTKAMKEEASKSGFFKTELTKVDYPKMQIITIKELLKGNKPNLPSSAGFFKEAQGIKDLYTGKQRKLFY